MSVESPQSVSENGDEAVTNQELLAMFRQQEQRIEALETELEREREQREELEETVGAFESFTGPALSKFVNKVVNDGDLSHSDEGAAFDEVDIIPAASEAAEVIVERADRLKSAEDTLRRHESEIEESQSLSADPQAEHWQRVVQKANNVASMSKHSLPDDWVILYKEDIAAAIEPGEKRAGQLINEWTDTGSEKFKQGTEKQPYKPPASSRNGRAQKKALKIDLNVWRDD